MFLIGLHGNNPGIHILFCFYAFLSCLSVSRGELHSIAMMQALYRHGFWVCPQLGFGPSDGSSICLASMESSRSS